MKKAVATLEPGWTIDILSMGTGLTLHDCAILFSSMTRSFCCHSIQYENSKIEGSMVTTFTASSPRHGFLCLSAVRPVGLSFAWSSLGVCTSICFCEADSLAVTGSCSCLVRL